MPPATKNEKTRLFAAVTGRIFLIFGVILAACLVLCGCNEDSVSQNAASPTVPARRSTATPIPATPTTSPVHADSDSTFVYYGNCFDLDEGTGLGSSDPACEFVLQPKTSQALIDFIPSTNAAFSQVGEISRQPDEAQCRQTAGMGSTAQTFDPQSGGYLCYRTAEGRYGTLRFLNSAANGLNIAFTTYEEPGVSSMYATPTAVQVYSTGRDVEFQYGWYFDSDLGESSKAQLDNSDFAIRRVIAGDDSDFNLQPVAPARFADMGQMPQAPDSQACQFAVYPEGDESRQALTLQMPTYLCLQSSEGRYGYLYVHSKGKDGVLFDWRTFAPVFETAPAETATPSPVYLEVLEQRVYFGSYLDLDEGSLTAAEADGSDLLIYPGPGGDKRLFELVPFNTASFTFNETLYAVPDAHRCRLSPVFDNQADTVDPFDSDGSYLCYQTSEGRYGYLHFLSSDDSSVTLDWHTFDSSGKIQSPQVNSTPDAADIGFSVPPATDPVWRESFDDGQSADGWQSGDANGSFEVHDGALQLTALHADNRDARFFTEQNISAYYLEAVFGSGPSCTSLDHYGLLFGGVEQGDGIAGYLFGISCNGRYVLRYYDGKTYTTLRTWTDHELIRRGSGQRNRLGVLAKDGRLVLYANGVPLMMDDELEQTGGLFGVYLGSVRSDFFQVEVEDIAFWAVE